MAKTAPKCPICGELTARDFRPFCSRRCADVDLARWLKGVYAIPVTDADADEDGNEVGAELAARDGSSRDNH
ncbi:MAG TPA: DNA gyrase inhibitor YacG [Hyphomicrobiaceae bacterium]|nr:DNA gyrase inhibitor YacG [Hyphomicrobiaceae bacterium]